MVDLADNAKAYRMQGYVKRACSQVRCRVGAGSHFLFCSTTEAYIHRMRHNSLPGKRLNGKPAFICIILDYRWVSPSPFVPCWRALFDSAVCYVDWEIMTVTGACARLIEPAQSDRLGSMIRISKSL